MSWEVEAPLQIPIPLRGNMHVLTLASVYFATSFVDAVCCCFWEPKTTILNGFSVSIHPSITYIRFDPPYAC